MSVNPGVRGLVQAKHARLSVKNTQHTAHTGQHSSATNLSAFVSRASLHDSGRWRGSRCSRRGAMGSSMAGQLSACAGS